MINKIKDIFNIINIRNPKNSELYKYAKYELDGVLETLKGSDNKKDYKMQKELNDNILKCVETFCKFGHSGGTAEYAIDNLIKILRYEPILPLTGGPSEWNEIYKDITSSRGQDKKDCIVIVYQNKRYPKLFKHIFIDKDTGEIVKTIYKDINLTDKECEDICFPYIPGSLSKTKYEI